MCERNLMAFSDILLLLFESYVRNLTLQFIFTSNTLNVSSVFSCTVHAFLTQEKKHPNIQKICLRK